LDVFCEVIPMDTDEALTKPARFKPTGFPFDVQLAF
jgi:hypothetical protein